MSIERKEEDRLREGPPRRGAASGWSADTGGGDLHGDEQPALHPVLQSAFHALNLAGISWCLVRLPSSPAAPTGDIDLLVDRADERRTRRVLRTLGFGRLPVWGRRDPEAFYLLYHPPTEHNICLHVATELSFGPGHAVRTGTAVGCLRRRRRRGVLFELDPNDAFWVLLLHCLLDKGSVPSRYRAGLQELAGKAHVDGELARVAEAVCPAEWCAPKMLERSRRGDWALLEYLARDPQESGMGRPFDRGLRLAAVLLGVLSSRSIRRYAWRKGRSLVPEVRTILRFVRRGLRNLKVGSLSTDRGLGLPFGRRRGFTVALLGPDGVGKSALATSLMGSFPGFAGVHTLYMGLGYAGLPRLARLPVPGSLAAVGLLTLWWRYLVARYHRERGRLVVFDRYTYDALLPPGRPLTGPQRFARWVWAHACPAPDLVLLLDAPGEVVYGRRGESEPVLLEAARRDFLSLLERIPQLRLVDASRPEEAVFYDVAECIRLQAARRNEDRG